MTVANIPSDLAVLKSISGERQFHVSTLTLDVEENEESVRKRDKQ